ncbi:MAG: hemolysin family protein [Clostridiales bacterium]|nr:hemolysin family protein [Clostridiales bacterium]
MLYSIVILIVLILVGGIFASAEIALSSSNRNRVKMREEKGEKGAARLLATIDEPNTFFATTQLYYTFISFFMGAFAASSFTAPLAAWVLRMGLPLSENAVEPVIFVLITAVLTYVALVFGELVPKRLAMQYAIPYAMKILPVLNVLTILALPFVKLLSVSAKLILKLMGIKDGNPGDDITKDELRMIVESGGEQGLIAESGQDMIGNIFEFDKLTAGDICIHRLDVVAVPIDADFQAVMDVLSRENYSRVPVYEQSLDNIRGVLHVKDMLHYMLASQDFSEFDIKTLLREAYFVPNSKKTDELFQEMRANHAYMAVVIDEYGGTMGIITMQDLVETIVGHIKDEYDVDEPQDIVSINAREFRVQGMTDLETVQDYFDVELPIEEYDTLSGFLVGQLGYIPSEDEKPEVVFNDLTFKVDSIKNNRIVTVTVKKNEPSSIPVT